MYSYRGRGSWPRHGMGMLSVSNPGASHYGSRRKLVRELGPTIFKLRRLERESLHASLLDSSFCCWRPAGRNRFSCRQNIGLICRDPPPPCLKASHHRYPRCRTPNYQLHQLLRGVTPTALPALCPSNYTPRSTTISRKPCTPKLSPSLNHWSPLLLMMISPCRLLRPGRPNLP